ncbi:hypothetical protein V1525DRAFT_427080 [Lipomyces kononenkoae]|uniref:Uncharacterized protein n=1 Tax=Lipomyces kononenkoae TaxID=34357 RepID=A0ACC3SXR8_LIPKO
MAELLCNQQPLRSIPNHVLLILGAGPRIGVSVAEKFASNGYKSHCCVYEWEWHQEGFLSLMPIPAVFDARFTCPSVVLYNAAALTHPPDKKSILSISAESVALYPYVAAQQALSGWKTLPKETKKTYIYTGNIMNVSIVPIPLTLDLGMGKSASAFWIGLADAIYSLGPGVSRHGDGKLKVMALDGTAHGEFYAQLANHEENGYVQFK